MQFSVASFFYLSFFKLSVAAVGVEPAAEERAGALTVLAHAELAKHAKARQGGQTKIAVPFYTGNNTF